MILLKSEKEKFFILGFCIAISLVIKLAFSFDGLYGQDGYAYLGYAKQLNMYLSLGITPEPFSWPIYYPLISALVSQIFGHLPYIMQLISVVSWGMTGILTYKLISLEFKENKQIFYYTLWFFILSPYVFRLGQLVMSDMLATLFIISSLYYGMIYKKNLHIHHLYLAVGLGIAAVMTRYPAVVVLFPIAIFMVPAMWRNTFHFLYFFGFIILLTAMTLPYFLLIKGQGSTILNHNAIALWNISNFLRTTFPTGDNQMVYSTPNIMYVFSHFYHPRYAFGGFFLLVMVVLKNNWRKNWLALYVSVVFYSFFLAGIQSQNSRFLLLTFPLVTIVLYPGFRAFNELPFFQKHRKIIYIGLISSQILLCYLSMKPILSRTVLEKQVVDIMKPYQKQTLYGFDMDVSLAGRGLEFNYKNLWVEKYDSFVVGGLVLFNPEKFSKVWEDKSPMNNWNKITESYEIDTLVRGPEGWNLYRIEGLKKSKS